MIREITRTDFESFWNTFEQVVKAQETYAFDPQMSLDEAYRVWCKTPQKAFVYVDGNDILGTYYIKPNAMGPSNHICNCGYMVSNKARGKGIARQLCEHSQQTAKALGYEAMQFNCVVSTNDVAVKLWQRLEFKIVGTLPKAYRHAQLGYVDCYVMYKWLAKA
ncbi:GNAT family N-acetyltransferase [Vibrio superstes]|uniref:N-acetyltransferase n=1 Tax=Vibrio superstes NBRC 103154 TaxID=1219062 RepID=A0A511QSV7_9VIBR|nr:GNAT family N-acetyltransferase [Vibrio superstes]GEM79632.1 N-acetyltransferase [Vibrio superstes NBRC 103154]